MGGEAAGVPGSKEAAEGGSLCEPMVPALVHTPLSMEPRLKIETQRQNEEFKKASAEHLTKHGFNEKSAQPHSLQPSSQDTSLESSGTPVPGIYGKLGHVQWQQELRWEWSWLRVLTLVEDLLCDLKKVAIPLWISVSTT